jgi:addiction module RelE/StbE family toxin
MYIEYHKHFKKKYDILSSKLRGKVQEKILLFASNPHAPELNNHKLHGEYGGCHSINITSDLRAIYVIDKEFVQFLKLDTHSNLY